MQRPRFRIGRAAYFVGLAICAVALNRVLQFRFPDGVYLTERLSAGSILLFDGIALAALAILMCARLVDAGKWWAWGVLTPAIWLGLVQVVGFLALDGKVHPSVVEAWLPWLPWWALSSMFYFLAATLAGLSLLPLVIGLFPSAASGQSERGDV